MEMTAHFLISKNQKRVVGKEGVLPCGHPFDMAGPRLGDIYLRRQDIALYRQAADAQGA